MPRRETAHLLLPTRRHVDLRAVVRTEGPPWHAWPHGGIARALLGADDRVRLVVAQTDRRGIRVRVVGVDAAQSETLAPIAARMRRALRLDGPGAAPFEAALGTLVDAAGPSARRAVFALGRRCPGAPSLRSAPTPEDLLAVPLRRLAKHAESAALARRIHALARAFAAIAPSSPRHS